MNSVAVDLGLISEEVRDLRRDAGLPGMAVLQFAFDGEPQNLYLPHNLENDLEKLKNPNKDFYHLDLLSSDLI